jgi:hypothetical protein
MELQLSDKMRVLITNIAQLRRLLHYASRVRRVNLCALGVHGLVCALQSPVE